MKNPITKNKTKCHFPAPQILSIFSQKFQGLVLAKVEWINAKGIDVAKGIKMHFLCFYPLFWTYVRQPDNHIGWVTSMHFASIYPTHPRINSWNFLQKILRIGGAGFFFGYWVFQKKIQMKISSALIWGIIYSCTMVGFFIIWIPKLNLQL